MKPTLQFRLTQQLALTPQLQQSIRLLQLSTLELNQEIEQALVDNPMLERVDDPMQGALRILPNGALEARNSSSISEHSGSGSGSDEKPASGDSAPLDGSGMDASGGSDWESDSGPSDGSYDSGNRPRGDEDGEDRSFLQVSSAGSSLHDHLMSQLGSLNCSHRDRGLVTVLIEEVNTDGYLVYSRSSAHGA